MLTFKALCEPFDPYKNYIWERKSSFLVLNISSSETVKKVEEQTLRDLQEFKEFKTWVM